MKRSAKALRIGAELAPLVMILGCLVGSLALIIAAYQRRVANEKSRVAAVEPRPRKRPEPPRPAPAPPPPEPPPRFEPPVDPTPALVAAIEAETERERARTAEAEAKLQALASARRTAEAEVARWRRQERLVREQAKSLDDQASRLEAEADALARMRDVLAERRDQEKAGLAQAESRARDSFAILPYRGEHGTWRRPIALECRDGMVKIQPDGPSLSMLDLGAIGYQSRSSPILAAVNRAFAQAREDVAPDGGVVVPYVLFLIRPDGIRAYYEARARLERLGIAFGYELVEQDLNLDFPDLNQPSEWPGAPRTPTRPPVEGRPSTLTDDRPGPGGRPDGETGNPYVWHAQEPPPTNRSPGLDDGLSFSDLERQLAMSRLGGDQPDKPHMIDGIDLSGPPIAYEPDPRRPGAGALGAGEALLGSGGPAAARSGNGLGAFEPSSRHGAGSSSLAGRSAVGADRIHESRNGAPGSLSLADRPAMNRGLGGSPGDADGGPGLPGDGRGLGNLGNLGSTAPGRLSEIPEARGGVSPIRPEAGGLAGDPEGLDRSGRTPTSGGTVEGPGSDPPERDRAEEGSLAEAAGSTGTDGLSRGLPTFHDLAEGAPLPITSAVDGDGWDRGGMSQARAGTTVGTSTGRAGQGTATRPGAGTTASAGSPTSRGGRGTGAPSSGGSGSNPTPGLGIGLNLPSMPSAGDSAPPALLSLGLMPEATTSLDPDKPKALSLVIDCRADGVTIQPGGYRLSRKSLENSDLLVRRLRAIANADPNNQRDDAPTPWLNFLVQPGGQETFWLCRRQTTFAGLNWPARLRVAESGGLESFQGRFR